MEVIHRVYLHDGAVKLLTAHYVLPAQDNVDAVVYDTHALGCSICVDINQDVMRLLDEGKTVPEIRAYVDQTYTQYGPSNMP
ncbi:MAG: PCYCGC motif-containing (lipo)protein [Anaerolineaceae bacterium]|nr:PCYCGC motif-containing (lipo)protein [Anaerolineaceae bacterium]